MSTHRSDVNWDVDSQKFGEILRNKSGQFSFVCLFCGAVFFNCNKIVEHIDMHFVDKKARPSHDNDVEMSELTLPEFVSTGVIKTEPKTEPSEIATATIVRQTSKKSSQLIPVDLLLKDIKTEKPDVDDSTQVDKTTTSIPKAPIVKIIKLKPVKLSRRLLNGVAGKQLVNAIRKDNQKTLPVDPSKPSTSASVVKIVNLKPLKLIPVRTTQANQIKALPNANQKNGTDKRQIITTIKKPLVEGQIERVQKTAGELSAQPEAIETMKNSPDGKKVEQVTETSAKPLVVPTVKKLVVKAKRVHQAGKSLMEFDPAQLQIRKDLYAQNKSLYSCYQCEMEPRIHNTSDPRRHFCHLCTDRVPNHDEFAKHIKNVHKDDVNNLRCNGYYCYACGKKFSTRLSLVSHLELVHNNTDLLCAVCGGIFSSFSRLNSHMKSAHEERSYECEHCGKVFKRIELLRIHVACHNTELNFVCKICSKGFKMQRYLNRHMAVHNDTKINCRHCDATFNFVSVRRAHEINRHNVV